MEIHNLMEDAVRDTLNELFDAEEKAPQLGFCTCAQCRMDVSCYVLNRIAPEYVTSGRGVVHGETDWSGKVQKAADVISLVREGWTKINQKKRPQFHEESVAAVVGLPAGPVFNFPSIMGRLFNGADFSPLAEIQVGLFQGDALLPMIDPNWQNPCTIVRETEGTYIFWPQPQPAKKAGLDATFELRIQAQIQGFEEISHYFELSLKSEDTVVDQFASRKVHKLPDLYVFPK
jgi:competence protein ComFB